MRGCHCCGIDRAAPGNIENFPKSKVMNKPIVVIGTAHLSTTPGKQSPDGRFKEYAYSRTVAGELAEELRRKSYTVYIDYMAPSPSPQMKGTTLTQEQSRELTYRVNFVNEVCSRYGAANCIYLSMHTDAAGADGRWNTARGFSVRVAPVASERSKTLARFIYEAAKHKGSAVTGNRAVPPQKYWVQDLYVLRKTACPAVLTESLFQDNREDVEYLLSDAGRKSIVDLHVNGIEAYTNKYFGK